MGNQSSKATSKGYLIGFFTSLILTVIPFYYTYDPFFSKGVTYAILFGCAVVQVFVHFIYFLHMETHTNEGRWNIVALLFSAVVVLILIVGSIWVMWNLNANMRM